MFDPQHHKSGTLFFDLLKFFLIFLVILVAVLVIAYSGVLNTETPTETTASTPIQTLPPVTTPPPATVATTTSAIATTTEATTTPVITTTQKPIYPPATVPSTKETTAVTTVDTTTAKSEPPIESGDITDEEMEALRIEKRFLTVHEDSRPGYKLTELKNIVVHYIGNAGTTADQNWRNFENNKPQTSAHFIIGLDGEILWLIPLDEVAWAIGTTEGNYTSISIECCHPDASGKFTDATYESLVKLVSWLCNKFDLSADDVLRHYDYERTSSDGSFTWHKPCPLYWANDKDPESHERWEAFKDDLILEN